MSKNTAMQYIKLTDKANFDLSLCNCSYSNVSPSRIWGPVMRDYYTIEFCVRGKYTVFVNDIPFPLEPGQGFAFFPGIVTIEMSEEKNGCDLLFIALKGSKISYYLKQLGVSEISPVFPWRYNDKIIQYANNIIEANKHQGMRYEFMQISNLCAMFSEFYDLHSSTQEGHHRISDASGSYINQVISFIEVNYPYKITVTDLARYVGLERVYFSRLFKKLTGTSPHQFLTQIRMKRAKEFLCYPQATVSNVAHSVGYEPFEFSKVFKRYTGMSPSEYMRKAQE